MSQKHPLEGKRVEIAPHYDLWMMGARFARVVQVYSSGRALVRMEHKQVSGTRAFPVKDLKELP